MTKPKLPAGIDTPGVDSATSHPRHREMEAASDLCDGLADGEEGGWDGEVGGVGAEAAPCQGFSGFLFL